MKNYLRVAAMLGIASAITLTSVPISAATLVAIDNGADSLVQIDSVTGVKTTVGSLGTDVSFGDLAYDGSTLFMLGGRGNNGLFSVNTTTGAATLIGLHGINDLFGLAFNAATGTLYATQFSGGQGVYTLNSLSGAATFLSNVTPGIGGLTFNTSTNQLVGTQDGAGSFYSINAATGAKTLLSAGSGFVNDGDLAFDASTNAYFLGDYNGNLYRYDASTYNRTLVAANLGGLDGIAILSSVAAVPEPSTWMLMLIGMAGVGFSMRRKEKQTLRVRYT